MSQVDTRDRRLRLELDFQSGWRVLPPTSVPYHLEVPMGIWRPYRSQEGERGTLGSSDRSHLL